MQAIQATNPQKMRDRDSTALYEQSVNSTRLKHLKDVAGGDMSIRTRQHLDLKITIDDRCRLTITHNP
jgi:hypothetical protein